MLEVFRQELVAQGDEQADRQSCEGRQDAYDEFVAAQFFGLVALGRGQQDRKDV